MTPRLSEARPATPADLDAVNRVVAQAMLGWSLPERVKRLALPSYLYQPHDLAALELRVLDPPGDAAAWE
jgi:hypothetical protein